MVFGKLVDGNNIMIDNRQAEVCLNLSWSCLYLLLIISWRLFPYNTELKPCIPEPSVSFFQKYFLPCLQTCSGSSSFCSFVITFAFALFRLWIFSFNLGYFFISCSVSRNSASKVFWCGITCYTASLMISKFTWAKSVVEMCVFLDL